MNKEEKKMQEMDDDSLEGVSGGYAVYDYKDKTYTLHGDVYGEYQGTYKSKSAMEKEARKRGTKSKIILYKY